MLSRRRTPSPTEQRVLQFNGAIGQLSSCSLETFPSVLDFGLKIRGLHNQCLALQSRNPVLVNLLLDSFFNGLGPRYAAFRTEARAKLDLIPAGSLTTIQRFDTVLVEAQQQEKVFKEQDAQRTRQGMVQHGTPRTHC